MRLRVRGAYALSATRRKTADPAILLFLARNTLLFRAFFRVGTAHMMQLLAPFARVTSPQSHHGPDAD
jgi:hypothetical protein